MSRNINEQLLQTVLVTFHIENIVPTAAKQSGAILSTTLKRKFLHPIMQALADLIEDLVGQDLSHASIEIWQAQKISEQQVERPIPSP